MTLPLSTWGFLLASGPGLLCCPGPHSLGSHEVLVLEGRALEVDDPLGPQGNLQYSAHLNIHFRGTQDDHVVVLLARLNVSVSEQAPVPPPSLFCFLGGVIPGPYWTSIDTPPTHTHTGHDNQGLEHSGA